MKRIILCLLIMIFSIGILNVDAVTIKPTGNSTALAGSDIDVYITLTRTSSEKQISAIEGKLNVDANVLTLKSAEVLLGNSWTEFSPIKANGTFAYGNLNYNSLISDTSKNLFKLTFTVKSGATGSTTISITDTMGSDGDTNEVSITGGSLTINITTWSGKITPTTATIVVGGTTTVTATETGAYKLNVAPTYTSSNTAVATVDSNGKVTGITAGTATITGKFGSYVAGTATITVQEDPSTWSGKITPTTATIRVGGTTTVTATETGAYKLNVAPTYTSSNTAVATVDSSGKVTGIKAGTATITGKFGNNVAGTATITVEANASNWSGTISPKTATIKVGGSTTITATETGTYKLNVSPTYISSDTEIATVDANGIVDGIKAGTVTITAMFGDNVAGTATITVESGLVITVKPSSATIAVGETVEFTHSIDKSESLIPIPNGIRCSWTSSDSSIATVSTVNEVEKIGSGFVKGIQPGTVTITCRYSQYNAEGTATVVVKPTSNDVNTPTGTETNNNSNNTPEGTEKTDTGKQNPETGTFIPIALVSCAVVGGVIFYLTKKKQKIFNV